MATAEVSNDGWPWTTSARAPDVVERQYPVAYAGRGLSLDTEGVNRSVNVAIPTVAAAHRRRSPYPERSGSCWRARPTWMRRTDRTMK